MLRTQKQEPEPLRPSDRAYSEPDSVRILLGAKGTKVPHISVLGTAAPPLQLHTVLSDCPRQSLPKAVPTLSKPEKYRKRSLVKYQGLNVGRRENIGLFSSGKKNLENFAL